MGDGGGGEGSGGFLTARGFEDCLHIEWGKLLSGIYMVLLLIDIEGENAWETFMCMRSSGVRSGAF